AVPSPMLVLGRLSVGTVRMAAMSEQVGLGVAGQRLGVSGGDIRRAGHSKVTADRLEAWEQAPPDWLRKARARKRRSARKAARRAEDRRLAPPQVAERLDVPVARLAGWMRDAGVTTPLTGKQVERWAAHPGSQPDWLRWNLSKHHQELARKAAAEQRNREAERARLDRVYREVVQMLADGDRKLRCGRWLDNHGDHETALMDIAWRAAKNCGLACGDEDPDWWALTFEEREALRVCGYRLPVEPEEHRRVVSLEIERHHRG
ncbi:MAG TPA: hypothetical protein VIU87_03680, partial [Mycobacterium sp.]